MLGGEVAYAGKVEYSRQPVNGKIVSREEARAENRGVLVRNRSVSQSLILTYTDPLVSIQRGK